VIAAPPSAGEAFACLWATGTGWGQFSLHRQNGKVVFSIKALAGTLNCRSCEIAAPGNSATVVSKGKSIESRVSREGERSVVSFADAVQIEEGSELRVEVNA